MFMKYEAEKIEAIEAITGVNYGCLGDLIPIDSIIPMLEDLLCEIDRLKEELEDEKEQRENYYKPISKYEEIGMSEKDFC